MPTITLIATAHKEKGLCNSQELFKIIEQINPDVIFEEIPPGKFEAVYAGTRQESLEVKAIKPYLQKHSDTHHYPVNLDIDYATEKDIMTEVDGIPIICNYHSPEYSNLSYQISHCSEKYGFSFLNCDRCSEIISRKKVLEKQVLNALKNDINLKSIDYERLNHAYKQWLDQNDDRENEMVRNIYNLMEQNKYSNALFLVGAAHRKPIQQKLQQYQLTKKIKLNWIFYSSSPVGL